MLWLGLRLSLRGGREARIRLALIAAAVAVGVVVLLTVMAGLHAFQATNDRPCWECTQGTALTGHDTTNDTDAELWNYSRDSFNGKPIKRLDVAALGPHAPVVPGIPRLPSAGQYYASPALAKLLAATPHDRLGARYPGSQAGVIGRAALAGPEELTIIIGRTPAQLAASAATVRVDRIETEPAVNRVRNLYRYGFGLVAIALLFPVLVLIGLAMRLAAARREQRFAALRLVGATPRQTSVIASVDALAGAVLGALAGVGGFLLLRPVLADVSTTGSRYFPDLVTPTATGYAAVLVGVPLAAAAAALWSLRRVRVSPFGTTRRVTPPAPRAWRVLPLLVGLALFTGPLVAGENRTSLPLVLVSLALIMIGLSVGGSWLTMQAARLVAKLTRGASGLLAARRLADNPKAAFRSVSGLVLAVFIGTAIAGIVPAVNASQRKPGGGTLSNVLRASFTQVSFCEGNCTGPTPTSLTAALGLPSRSGADLVERLRSYPGVTVLPVYAKPARPSRPAAPAEPTSTQAPPGGQGVPALPQHIVDCASLPWFPALGHCAPGVRAVQVDFDVPGFRLLLGAPDTLAMERELPIITQRDTTTFPGDPTRLHLGGVLINTPDPATLERVRTLLSAYSGQSGTFNAPQTFGEIAETSAALYNQIQQATLLVVALTLLVAGCSLAVAVGGGLVERKRPFTLLRLTGAPTPALYRVVLLESILPLLLAAMVAAGAGLAVAGPVVDQLTSNGTVALPGQGYFLSIGAGLTAALALILTGLPLLRRITEPNNARFE
jgi:FtsX-like permease family